MSEGIEINNEADGLTAGEVKIEYPGKVSSYDILVDVVEEAGITMQDLYFETESELASEPDEPEHDYTKTEYAVMLTHRELDCLTDIIREWKEIYTQGMERYSHKDDLETIADIERRLYSKAMEAAELEEIDRWDFFNEEDDVE